MALAAAGMFFGLAYLGHALICRLKLRGNSVVKFLIVGSAAGLALMARLTASGVSGAEFRSAVLLYAFICEVYIFFFTFTGTSVSAQLLFVLRREPLSEAGIERLAPKTSMVAGRVQKLIGEGLMTSQENRMALTRKGQKIVRCFRALQSFFGHRSDAGSPRSSKRTVPC